MGPRLGARGRRGPCAPALVLGLLPLGFGCGDAPQDDAPEVPRLGLLLAAEDGTRRCEGRDGLDRILVFRHDDDGAPSMVFEDDGRVCQSGLPRAELGPAPARLRIEARGQLGIERVLYAAELELPAETEPDASLGPVILEPQVAFLRLGWAPPEDRMDVCGRGWTWEVRPDDEDIEAVEPVAGRSACEETVAPSLEERALVLPTGRYQIAVRVENLLGAVRFARTDARVLSPGPNVHQALLTPVGGRIAIDWQFDVHGEITRDCDGFSVDEVTVLLRAADAPDDVLAAVRVPCGARRPHFLSTEDGPLRVAPGRQLTLELGAEGHHRFRGTHAFEMPLGDEERWVDLRAVGRGRVTWTLAEASCADPEPDEVEVTVEPSGDAAGPSWSAILPGTDSSTVTNLLPYGEWSVWVEARRPEAPTCRATSQQTIESAYTDWPPLLLRP